MSEAILTEAPAENTDRRRWLALAVIVAAQFMVVLDVAIVNVALPSIRTDLRFSQEITDWHPGQRYAFTFRADPGFRVAYALDLCDGPFRMVAGAYEMSATATGTRLALFSQYELRGATGALLGAPVRAVLGLFQQYLLRGIRANAERAER